MNTVNIFEQASRKRIRFNTGIGLLSVEDVWQLPLTNVKGANLDWLAMQLQEECAAKSKKSFVHKVETKDEDAQLRFDIVLHIISVKLAEREEAEKAQERHDRRQRIMALIERKENEQFDQKSLDELRAELNTYS